MLWAILNESWRQHPTRHQLYGHLPPITKTIQVRWTRHAGHYWRSRDELISDVLLWTPAHGRAKAGRPAWTYIQQLCEDTGCCPEDLPEAMNDREKWRERVRDIHATSMTWWWWWWWWWWYNSYNLTSVICLHTVCSIWPIDRTLSGVTTLGQSETGSNDNEGVLHFPQISKAGASSSDDLMSYPRHLLGGGHPTAEMQSVYSTATADWAIKIWEIDP